VKQQLRVPVPETVTASYLIPLKTVMTVTEARRQILKAVEGCVPDPLRTVILHGIRQGAVIVHVTAAPVPPDGTSSVFAEELTRLAGSPPFVQVTVTSPASVIAVQEWKARGSAAALAASLGVPLIDARALDVLTAQEALTSLPDAKFLSRPDTDVAVGLSLQPWVRLHGFADQEKCWATSNGMWRFGLPEFRMGGYRPDLRREVEQILLGVIFRAWTGLIEEAQATPRGGALFPSTLNALLTGPYGRMTRVRPKAQEPRALVTASEIAEVALRLGTLHRPAIAIRNAGPTRCRGARGRGR
jgi:hypothetical protein